MAREAGALALAGRRGSVLERVTKSSTTDLVTQHDRAAEALIVEQLRTERPTDAIVGEEGATLDGTSGYAWFLDPIDGTTNFVYDLPSWCTSVAVAYHGVDRRRGGLRPGRRRDVRRPAGRRGHARRHGRSGAAARPTSRWRSSPPASRTFRRGARVQAAAIARLIAEIRDIRRSGSAAIDLCWAAAGRVDAYFEEHLNSWDAAAGELIAREAGCITSDFDGGPADPSNIVAAAPGIHAALLDLIRRSLD